MKVTQCQHQIWLFKLWPQDSWFLNDAKMKTPKYAYIIVNLSNTQNHTNLYHDISPYQFNYITQTCPVMNEHSFSHRSYIVECKEILNAFINAMNVLLYIYLYDGHLLSARSYITSWANIRPYYKSPHVIFATFIRIYFHESKYGKCFIKLWYRHQQPSYSIIKMY